MQKHSAIAREMYKTIEPRLIEVAREVGPETIRGGSAALSAPDPRLPSRLERQR